jgi:hypothetical protein
VGGASRRMADPILKKDRVTLGIQTGASGAQIASYLRYPLNNDRSSIKYNRLLLQRIIP